MRHLITGGAGFLGNLIAQRLAEQGEEVTLLDVLDNPTRPQSSRMIRGSVRDRSAITAALQGIDVVHHNAALVPVLRAGRGYWLVNVEGSRLVAEEAVKAGVQCFIHMSSSAIYGVPPCPITAETPPNPAEIYGRSKLAGELAVRQVCEEAGLPLIVVRPRTILGRGRMGIFQLLFRWIREGRVVYMIGSGENRIQFIHADDLIEAYSLALKHRRPGIYNVGTDRFGSLRQTLTTLITHAQSRSRLQPLPAPLTISVLRALDALGASPMVPWHYLSVAKDFYFDISQVLALDWAPRYSNDEMLRESYDDFVTRMAEKPREAQRSPHRRPVQERLLGLLRRVS